MFGALTNLFSLDKEKTVEQVGDFSEVDEEFNIDTAVKVMGYKTVVAKHSGSGQKMIIVDSGKKKLLTKLFTMKTMTNGRKKNRQNQLLTTI